MEVNRDAGRLEQLEEMCGADCAQKQYHMNEALVIARRQMARVRVLEGDLVRAGALWREDEEKGQEREKALEAKATFYHSLMTQGHEHLKDTEKERDALRTARKAESVLLKRAIEREEALRAALEGRNRLLISIWNQILNADLKAPAGAVKAESEEGGEAHPHVATVEPAAEQPDREPCGPLGTDGYEYPEEPAPACRLEKSWTHSVWRVTCSACGFNSVWTTDHAGAEMWRLNHACPSRGD